jgi:hypothetical protein
LQYKYAHDSPSPVPGLGLSFAERGTLRSVTGLLLRTYLSRPTTTLSRSSPAAAAPARAVAAPVKGVLVFLPALHSHMTHYAVVSEYLTRVVTANGGAGFVVCGVDYHGHGESEGTRGLLPVRASPPSIHRLLLGCRSELECANIAMLMSCSIHMICVLFFLFLAVLPFPSLLWPCDSRTKQ